MTKSELEQQLAATQERLSSAEQILNAIYHQEVDAVIINGPQGDQVFTLQGAETSYRLLVEAMNEGAITALPDGTILYCNPRFAEMARQPVEQIIGSSCARFFPKTEHNALAQLLKQAGEQGIKGEFTLETGEDSTLPVQLSVRTLRLDNVCAVAVLVTDVAELRTAHRALFEANERLEQRVRERTAELVSTNHDLLAEISQHQKTERALAKTQKQLEHHAADLEQRIRERTGDLREKIAELEVFSYSVSHDLRAPLRSIHGFGQILIEELNGKLDAEHAGYLSRIVSNASQLDHMIQEVLVYSRTGRGELNFCHVDIDTLIRDTIQSYMIFQPPSAHITIDAKLPPVIAHEAMLTQCISNLLGNAVKFVSRGTVPRVRIYHQEFNGHTRIWFEDNGIGIEPDDITRIFRIFERVHSGEDFPGTGIGLSIVKKAIERMGGTVGVESKPGVGSAFWIELASARTT